MIRTRAIERPALFGSLLAASGEIHPFCDHRLQGSETARCKSLCQHVYRGVHPIDAEDAARAAEPTMTASARGRRTVATDTAIQTGATTALTRAFGYRIPASALLAGAAINGVTHPAIYRGAFFLWLAKKARQPGCIERCQAVRLDKDDIPKKQIHGPGTARIKLDAALHRVIGVGAAAVTTWLATRKGGR